MPIMIKLKHSQNLAARPRPGCFIAMAKPAPPRKPVLALLLGLSAFGLQTLAFPTFRFQQLDQLGQPRQGNRRDAQRHRLRHERPATLLPSGPLAVIMLKSCECAHNERKDHMDKSLCDAPSLRSLRSLRLIQFNFPFFSRNLVCASEWANRLT